MRILVCGSRNFRQPNAVMHRLEKLPPNTWIIHGGASGADSLADLYARRLGISVSRFPANWAEFGKAAGFIRNKHMLDQNPDLVVAFVRDPNNSPGTANMVLQALCAGVKGEVHTYDG